MKLQKISNDELKKIEFSILKEFKAVCEANGLKYSLLAGTLLGAVRHRGFIPWDDDIDVCMPRDDYEKLVSYYINNKTKYTLFCSKTDFKYCALYGKLSDNQTVLVEHIGNRNKLNMGVNIDIFIYDAMGDSIEVARKKFNKTRFKRELLIASNWGKYKPSKTHAWYYEPFRFCFFLLSRFASPKNLIDKIEKEYSDKSFYQVDYVGNLASDRRTKSIIKRSCFDKYIELEFEGELFKVFEGYETYLKEMYGDYMQFPPEKKRVTHHDFDAYIKTK